MFVLRIFVGFFILFLVSVPTVFAQDAAKPIAPFASPQSIPTSGYYQAKVVEIVQEEKKQIATMEKEVQTVRVSITSGDEKGKEVLVRHGDEYAITQETKVKPGDLVIIQKIGASDGIRYFITDRDRLPGMGIGIFLFLVLAAFFGRGKGIRAIFGMFLSVGIIVGFLLPQLIAGQDPFLMSILTATAIACLSLYVAHGISVKTTLALGSTLVTLFISAILASLAVSFIHLSGTGSEEALFLKLGSTGSINLQGLLLGGIIIGALGVLDDITTAQTATVFELHMMDKKLSFENLYRKGINVGREHIASLVNTLALAYVGVSLPLFLLFFVNNKEPLWITLNSEYIAEEVVRTLVGSSALILAVPLSTFTAAWWFSRKNLH